MRAVLRVSCLLDLSVLVSGIAGMLLELDGLLILAGVLLVLSVIHALLRFRCPFCRKFVGLGNYAPGRFCPFCGTELDNPSEQQ